MSTLLSIQKLTKQIREGLAGGVTALTVEELAAEYVRLAQEAAQRLEACAVMIDKGSDYQALQLAETEPALLDVIAALSFAEAPEWAAFCRAQGLPAAPKFDARAVQALDGLYAKGISAQHPLYKDYRAAVTSRDDARALQIIRTVVRLNPGDANAQSELVRLENKLLQLQLQELRSALAQRDETVILNRLDALERLAPPAKLAELPEYARAGEIRRLAARRAAEAEAAQLAAGLTEERAQGGWRKAAGMLLQIKTLQSEHGFTLPAEAAASVAGTRPWVEGERAAAEQTARFQQALNALGASAEQLDTRLLTRATLSLPEAGERYLDFNRRWKEVEQFQRPVPEDVVQRVRTTAAALRTELDRLQRQRRIRIGLAAAAAVTIFAAAAWFAVRAYRAQDYLQQLTALQSSGQVEAAERMIAHLRAEQAGLAAQPALRAGLDSTDRWTRDERARLADATAQLVALDQAAETPANSDPVAFHRQLESAAQLIDALPAGLRSEAAARLTVRRNHFEADLAGRREKLNAQAEAELARLELTAGQQLGYDQPRATIETALGEIEPAVKALEARAGSALAALHLPAALQARAAAVRQRAEVFRKEIELLRTTHEALLQAQTLDAYRVALGGFKDSRLAQVAEVHQARQLLAVFPQPDEILAALLLPGDAAAWAAAKNDTAAVPFIPDTVLPVEMTRLLALREDMYLHDIWQATLTDLAKGGKREVFSRGEIKKEGPREVGGGIQATSWSGAIYDVAAKTDLPAFAPASYYIQRSTGGSGGTGEISGSRRSPASDCLAHLELNRMTDADGAKYEKALLRVCEELVRNKEVPPLFKAYLMQEFGKLMAVRPYAWGLQYCGSLRADLAKLAELCGDTPLRSMDWLLERKRSQLGGQLTPFFAQLQSRTYLGEAQLHRRVVRQALDAGLRYGGFLDAAGRAQLLGEAGSARTLWTLPVGGERIARFDPKAAESKGRPAFARYSPVFYVPLDREKLLTSAATPGAKPPAIPLLD